MIPKWESVFGGATIRVGETVIHVSWAREEGYIQSVWMPAKSWQGNNFKRDLSDAKREGIFVAMTALSVERDRLTRQLNDLGLALSELNTPEQP